MDYSLPGSLAHGDSQGKSTGEGFHDILQGIVPTQDSNQDFLFTSWAIREDPDFPNHN